MNPFSRLLVAAILVFGWGNWNSNAWSQGWLDHPIDGIPFVQNDLPSIHIECGDALEWIYEEANWYSNVEHPASFVFESNDGVDSVGNVGFRLRGNTSRAANKKSFKISFNTFNAGGSWEGLEKLNLNGEHNDPSILRARLIWEGMRDAGLPVSRSNHVNLFINGVYHGLYYNLEHIDEEWLEKRFALDHGNLWKCTYPANLMYAGPDGDDYKFTPNWSNDRVYDLKTNVAEDNYVALARFIDVLNNEPLATLPCALEDVFDVQGYLKTAAAEILCGHWDNYIGNQNNFYLYQRPEDQRIVYIPYDADNSFGIQWFGEWTSQDPYNWTDALDRPLYTRLMAVPEYRMAFTYYMRQQMENAFAMDWLEGRGEVIQSIMGDAVVDDSFYTADYGFDVDDFDNALNESSGGHVAWGIVPFMESRQFWADIQLDDVLEWGPLPLMAWAQSPALQDTLVVKAWTASTDFNATTSLQANVQMETAEAISYPLAPMESNAFGTQWEIRIPMNGSTDALWSVLAESEVNAVQSPCVPQLVWNEPLGNGLVINEVMPLNNSFLQDEAGGYADWVELYNAGPIPINLGYHRFTNRIDWPDRWSLPNVTLGPGQHLVLYCDDDPEEGPLHAPFHLDSEEGDVFITTLEADAWRLIDAAHWTSASPNASRGRTSDGAPSWMWFFPFTDTPPTPNAPNGETVNSISNVPSDPSTWRPMNPRAEGQSLTLPDACPWQLFQANGALVAHGESAIVPGAYLKTGPYILHRQLATTADIHSTIILVQ
ncbi:MAG: CotH kinase family protein [Bacteroidetes bacterium]|nr:CotH kinase family protein [Bacteroidota bacterium]